MKNESEAFEILAQHLTPVITQLVASSLLGEPLATAGGKIGWDLIKNFRERRQIERKIETFADHIVEALLPLFHRVDDPHQFNPVPVVYELSKTLEGKINAKFLLSRDANEKKVYEALRHSRKLPRAQYSEAEEELYERSLRAIAAHLVCVVHELPNYEPELASQLLARMSALESQLPQLLADYQELQNRLLEKGVDEFERDFRRLVVQKYDYLEIFGLDISDHAARHYPLSVAFVELEVKEPEESPKLRSFGELLDDLKSGPRRILLKGEAGSGKSTLMRWATLEAAGLRRDSEWAAKTPFLVRLRDYRSGNLPKPKELPSLLSSQLDDAPPNWCRDVLKSGQALVLLDGVDEIPNSSRDRVRREIAGYVKHYRKSDWLVSSRPAALSPGWLSEWNFLEVEIRAMTDQSRSSFIDRWHEAVAEQFRRDNRSFNENFEEYATNLKTRILRQPELGRLATNPLLCAAICALNYCKEESLPDTIRTICEALCNMLLNERDQRSGLRSPSPQEYRDLSSDQKRILVEDLAYWMVRNGESRMPNQDFEAQISLGLTKLRLDPKKAKLVCEGLLERSGLIRRPREGYVEFIHNTLKEYLAGERFAKERDIGLLASNILKPGWREVALFAARSDAHGQFADKLVRKLLDPGKQVEEHQHRAKRLIAAQVASESLLLSKKTLEEAQKYLGKNPRPRSTLESVSFSALGDFILPFLEWNSELDEEVCLASAYTLRLMGTPKAVETLVQYIRDQNESVWREVTGTIKTFPRLISLFPEISVERRVYCAEVFSTDDPRFASSRYNLPNDKNWGFIKIPGGKFLAEHTKQERKLPTFYLSKYPVTVAQFRLFVGDSTLNNGNHPVTHISRDKASAYCSWLQERLATRSDLPSDLQRKITDGWTLNLPSEMEWEKAARGTDGRLYPWGPNWIKGNANCKNIFGRTTPVGCFPGGKSPYGLEDMAGNVREWTRSEGSQGEPILRGGSFDYESHYLKCSARAGYETLEERTCGFRVALTPPKKRRRFRKRAKQTAQ